MIYLLYILIVEYASCWCLLIVGYVYCKSIAHCEGSALIPNGKIYFLMKSSWSLMPCLGGRRKGRGVKTKINTSALIPKSLGGRMKAKERKGHRWLKIDLLFSCLDVSKTFEAQKWYCWRMLEGFGELIIISMPFSFFTIIFPSLLLLSILHPNISIRKL